MKNTFSGFYNPSKSQITAAWKSDDTIFIFDTNVLLSLYSYQEETRESFLSTLDLLKEKIWIPYQVGMEYQFNRLKIISENKKKFSDVEKSLEGINNDIEKIKNTINSTPFEKYRQSADEVLQKINPIIEEIKVLNKDYAGKCPEVRSEDKIRKRLNDLFNNRTGARPKDQKWIDDLAKEGKERYEKKIPPGFEDAKKAGQSPKCYDGLCYPNEYGDLILWKQIIEHIKQYPKRHVILISDDKKSDWMFEINSHGNKTIGPHADLKAEIYRETSAKLFHICDSSEFLAAADERVPDTDIDKKHLLEVKSHIRRRFQSDLIEDKAQAHDFLVPENLPQYTLHDNLMMMSPSLHKQLHDLLTPSQEAFRAANYYQNLISDQSKVDEILSFVREIRKAPSSSDKQETTDQD